MAGDHGIEQAKKDAEHKLLEFACDEIERHNKAATPTPPSGDVEQLIRSIYLELRPNPDDGDRDLFNRIAQRVRAELARQSGAKCPSPTPAVAISYDDVCALSRCWNEKHAQPHGVDYRVNQWLKDRIVSAITPPSADVYTALQGMVRLFDEQGNMIADFKTMQDAINYAYAALFGVRA